GVAQAVLEARTRPEAEPALGPGRVDAPARLPVGLGGVPHDAAGEARELRHDLDEVPDADLHPGAEVDGLRTVVALGGQHDRLRRVLHVEEFARGRLDAPAHVRRRGPLDGIDVLFDGRGESVRVLMSTENLMRIHYEL